MARLIPGGNTELPSRKKRTAATIKDLTARGSGTTNQLLRVMPRSVLDLLRPAFDVIQVTLGEVLFEPGDDMTHAYFPLGGTILSLVIPLHDGSAVEAATVGREGAVGGIVSLGLAPAYCRATVQIPGLVARITVDRLEAVKRTKPRLHDLLTRYADCFAAQVFQAVVCASVHSLEQRCARWLLMIHDRLQSDDLPLTQEALAEMFGVARPYASKIAQKMQRSGAIQYHRGVIHIAERAVLAKTTCECYGLVKRHFDRVLPGLYPKANTD